MTHDPTYGGLLMKDADFAFLTEVSEARRQFIERKDQREASAARLRELRDDLARMHPEVISPLLWLSIRRSYLDVLTELADSLGDLNRAEFETVVQQVHRCADKGLI